MHRYALVTGARTRQEVEAYLPENYRTIHLEEDARSREVVIKGTDDAGWTLDDYVIPRLATGLMACEEIDLSHPIMKRIPVGA